MHTRLRLFALGLCAAMFSPAVEAAVAADEVKALPGWDGSLPSRHYSGYLPVRGGQSFMHYYLQLSEGNPSKDPVTLWMNGGPGCTSVKGAFEELGQLVFNRKSNVTGNAVPKLFYNPLAWTRSSSMLYFESPPGVGFSYCKSCIGNQTCRCFANDTTTAEDNYDAVAAFFTAYPEFVGNNFFITGESYAGTYIPMLMRQISEHNSAKKAPAIPLVGAAIGNGCWGNKVGVCGGDGARIRAEFYWGKGLYSRTLKDQIVKICGPFDGPEWVNTQGSGPCATLLTQMNLEVGPHNFYNLDDFCPREEMLGYSDWVEATSMSPTPDGGVKRMDDALHRTAILRSASESPAAEPLGALQMWCGVDRAMFAWLDLPEVKEALHVADPAKKNVEQNNLQYQREGADDLRPLYKQLAQEYRLWIYNGQEDGCVPFNGAEDWVRNLGYAGNSTWRPWFGGDDAGGQRVAAGYITQYGSPAKDFAFVTVKGAGHEVPTFQPAAAYTMFTRFVNDVPL